MEVIILIHWFRDKLRFGLGSRSESKWGLGLGLGSPLGYLGLLILGFLGDFGISQDFLQG